MPPAPPRAKPRPAGPNHVPPCPLRGLARLGRDRWGSARLGRVRLGSGGLGRFGPTFRVQGTCYLLGWDKTGMATLGARARGPGPEVSTWGPGP